MNLAKLHRVCGALIEAGFERVVSVMILVEIAQAGPRGTTVTAISAATGLPKSTISRIVIDELAPAGWVSQEPSYDRRSKWIVADVEATKALLGLMK